MTCFRDSPERNSKIGKAMLRRIRRRLDAAWAQGLTPTPRMSLPEWADTYRRLSISSGARGGRWRTSTFEIARGPMMAVKERGVRTITAKVATQMLKTELLLNIIGYHAHLDPCPILLTQAKEESVRGF